MALTAATNQFGNVAPTLGFQPQSTFSPAPISLSERTPISTSSALALRKNSPVKVVAGVVLAAVAGDSEKVVGTIDQLFDSNGNVVQSVAATPASGYTCIYTDGADQVYAARVDTAAYADTDIGKYYNLSSTDGATAGTDRFLDPGDSYSERTLDGSTEATSGKQFRVIGRVKTERNDAASSAGTLVYCKINPSNYSPGEAS